MQRAPQGRPPSPPSHLRDTDTLAAAIFTLGSGGWKILAAWSNIDFLLSIREQTFSTMFDFFENTGWVIAIAVGLAILIFQWRKPPGRRTTSPTWGLVASISAIAFLFGILLAVRSSGGVPSVISQWGTSPPKCFAAIGTGRLMTFSTKYKVAFICGFVDFTVDKLEDSRQ
jgi:hypothetical protein